MRDASGWVTAYSIPKIDVRGNREHRLRSAATLPQCGGLTGATPIATDADTAGRLLATAAAGPRPGDSGAYIDQGKIAPSSPASYDKDREEELWTAARLTASGHNQPEQ
jgi:hypothetical protein